MSILVCKPYNAFIEPCCAQFRHGLRKDSALFSDDVVATYAYLKKQLRECSYRELRYPFSRAEADEASAFDAVVLFTSFPKSMEELDELIDFTRAVRDKGTRLCLVCRKQGYIDELVREYDLCDVAIQTRDTLAAMKALMDTGLFHGGAWPGNKVIKNEDVEFWEECHGRYSFLMAPEVIGDRRYRTMPEYRKQRSITAGFGCRAACTFCHHRHTATRSKNPKILAAEISMWEGGIELFHTNLFQDRDWLEQFIEELAVYPPKNRSIRTLGRIDDMHKNIDLLSLCKEQGIDAVNIGVESANSRVLKSMKKNNNIDKFKELAKRMREVGMEPLINVLIGMPEEDHASLKETFDLLDSFGFSSTSCSLLRPLPGTPVYDQVISEGLVKESDLGLGNYLDILSKFTESQPHLPTKYLSMEELSEWHGAFKRRIVQSNTNMKYKS